MVGLMAAEYVNGRKKRDNERFVRELLASAQTAAERRFALRWADEHGVNIENLRDVEGRRYQVGYRRRRRQRRRLRLRG